MSKIISEPDATPLPDLAINPDKVCHVIARARMFDVKEGVSDPDSGSNASDDGMTDILEDTPSDPTYQELMAFIRALDEDERTALLALAWVGRGTYELSEWAEALEQARAQARPAEYLTGLPLLGDYLEEGLAAFGENCEGFDQNRM